MSLAKTLDQLEISPRKREILTLNHSYLMPNRVETWAGAGVPLVIGRREGYRFWDLDGHELQDLHINGGTYNLGHRNPELVRALVEAVATLDVGNHHFPSEARGRLAEALARHTPGDLHYSVLAPSGGEANDVAIKSARRATGRRKIVSLEAGYHGASGLSGAAGNDTEAAYFHSDYPDEFVKVPFGDLDAMEKALTGRDVAAVLIEPIPATFGFPIPDEDYLPGVRSLCDRYESLLVADEVQTGLGRTGQLWAVEAFGVQPDMLITGKGLGGGLYPIGAVVMTREVGAWLGERGWGYVSTFGGSELGCVVALRSLELSASKETARNVAAMSAHLEQGLGDIRSRQPFLCDVRQKGLIVGLGFDDPYGGLKMAAALYPLGLWAMLAGFDRRYLQFKPGLLVDRAFLDEGLEKLETAIRRVAG
jgi:acetylornithine/succinyldiaminopimelate/putrescine aminotransferase